MTIELEHFGEVYKDDRGRILNLLERSCGGVSIIESNAGARRSDHWHREDGHWFYVVQGQFEYFERPVGSPDKPAHRTIRQGEMVYTGPGVEHATVFPVYTVLLSMSLRPRDHASHERDVVRLAEPLPIE